LENIAEYAVSAKRCQGQHDIGSARAGLFLVIILQFLTLFSISDFNPSAHFIYSEDKFMDIVETGKVDNALIVSVKGRMDVISAPEFEKAFDEWIDAGEFNFIVDFSNLEFISSAGIRSILVTAKKLEGRGGRVVLAGPKAAVKKVFEISGFYALIPIFETTDDALRER
jgi:anti-anti-sigma factor